MAVEGKGRSIAIAGILATAVVGVIGSGATWLVARDERSNQRSLAHESHVYDRRADAYLAALRLIERQRVQFLREMRRAGNAAAAARNVRLEEPSFAMALDRDGYMYARVVAFGSSPVVKEYERLREIADNASTNELSLLSEGSYGKIPDTLLDSYDNFEVAEKRFQLLVQRELR